MGDLNTTERLIIKWDEKIKKKMKWKTIYHPLIWLFNKGWEETSTKVISFPSLSPNLKEQKIRVWSGKKGYLKGKSIIRAINRSYLILSDKIC